MIKNIKWKKYNYLDIFCTKMYESILYGA